MVYMNIYELYSQIKTHSHHDHSIGVALIVWHFNNISKTISSLLLDNSIQADFLTIDFVNNNYSNQESTEKGAK